MSIEYIQQEMPVLPDWYCCLSVALDQEEDEGYTQQYLAYISGGGDPKKFPKRRKKITARRREDNPVNMVMGAIQKSGLKIPGIRGSPEEYARARGLQKVYQMPDGTFVDAEGNPVEPASGSVFVKSTK